MCVGERRDSTDTSVSEDFMSSSLSPAVSAASSMAMSTRSPLRSLHPRLEASPGLSPKRNIRTIDVKDAKDGHDNTPQHKPRSIRERLGKEAPPSSRASRLLALSEAPLDQHVDLLAGTALKKGSSAAAMLYD
jgi:hypothetical protein